MHEGEVYLGGIIIDIVHWLTIRQEVNSYIIATSLRPGVICTIETNNGERVVFKSKHFYFFKYILKSTIVRL